MENSITRSYAVVIDSVEIATQQNKQWYFAGGKGFTSSPSSVPSNTFFDPRLRVPYLARRDLFDKATTYGVVSTGDGSLVLENVDGELDELVTDYAINGREVRVYVSDSESNNFPDDYTLAHKAIALIATSDDKEVTIRLSDKTKIFDKPLLQNKYLGNNSLPNGTEGLEGDLKDRRKPRVYGKVLNISPYFVNTARLIYQVSDKHCTIINVYTRGIPWTNGGSYSAFADLQNDALEPSPNNFKWYSGSEGTFFRLGSTPAGTITCDAETTEKRASELIKQVALDAGLTLSEMNIADFTEMSAITYQCGVFATDETTALNVMSELASAIGCFLSFDRYGILRIGILEVPTVSNVSFYKDQYMQFRLLSTSDTDNGIPAKKLTLHYGKNYTTQDDLDNTAATSERVSFSKLEWRKAVKENAATGTIYKDAPEVDMYSSLIDYNDAASECQRRIDQLQQRRLFEVSVRISRELFESLDVNGGVTLYHDRFGLQNGKTFCCIGIAYNFMLGEVLLRLWG